jgi:hypothetical protein
MEMESGYFPSLRRITKGLEKEVAQKQFISEAESLGIPAVKWERFCDVNDPLEDVYGWPPKENTDELGKMWSTVSRKLISRSEMPLSPTIVGNEDRDITVNNGQHVIWSGLDLIFRIFISIWTTLPPAKSGGVRDRKRRLHTRSWKEA